MREGLMLWLSHKRGEKEGQGNKLCGLERGSPCHSFSTLTVNTQSSLAYVTDSQASERNVY